MSHPKPATVGQLKETAYSPRSVKDELRQNLIRKLKEGRELFPGIVGYRDSVIPQIVNGILSKHDLLFLGLRQAQWASLAMVVFAVVAIAVMLRRRRAAPATPLPA